jgi:hypothetical protein
MVDEAAGVVDHDLRDDAGEVDTAIVEEGLFLEVGELHVGSWIKNQRYNRDQRN